jgi:hypothetical protein
MSISRVALETDLAALVSPALAKLLVNSYVEMQQRYFSGDWKPAELDGGQFCEAVARALYQVDTGNVSTELPGKICDYLLDKGKVPGLHKLDRKDRDHFCRVLQTTYKFRSDRGVAHISPTHDANYADASLIVMNVKWMFAEFLRLAWNSDRNKVAAIIEAITQLEHPLVHELDGKPLVLSTNLSTAEEVLVLLSRSAGGQLTRDELKSYVKSTPNAVSTAIYRLTSSREVRVSDAGEIVITPPGERRVREVIIPKLDNSRMASTTVRRRSSTTTSRKRVAATATRHRS